MRNNTFIITVVLLFLITGCSDVNSYQKSIFTDEAKISKQGDSYTFISRTGKMDENTLSLTFKGFYGKQTIWEVNADEDSVVDLNITTIVNGGKFKICLINSIKEVFIISEDTQKENVVLNVPKGKYHISIVGSNAKGDVDMIKRVMERCQ